MALLDRDKLHYFKWYPKDCDADENVRRMDDRDLGFYLRCLNQAWNNGGSIPSDLGELAESLKYRKPYVEARWVKVGRCFKAMPENPGRLVNPRQFREWELARTKSANNTRAAEDRWGQKRMRSHSDLSKNALPRAYDSSYEGVFVVSGESPKTPLLTEEDFSVWFERQYVRHPKKKADRMLAAQYASIHFSEGKFTLSEFEACHIAWCDSEDWLWKHGANAPLLSQWVTDGGYRYRPPVNSNGNSRQRPETALEQMIREAGEKL